MRQERGAGLADLFDAPDAADGGVVAQDEQHGARAVRRGVGVGGAALGAAVAPGVEADGGGPGVGGGVPGGERAQGREVPGAGRHPAGGGGAGDGGGAVAVSGDPDGPGPPGDTFGGGFAVRGRHGRPFLVGRWCRSTMGYPPVGRAAVFLPCRCGAVNRPDGAASHPAGDRGRAASGGGDADAVRGGVAAPSPQQPHAGAVRAGHLEWSSGVTNRLRLARRAVRVLRELAGASARDPAPPARLCRVDGDLFPAGLRHRAGHRPRPAACGRPGPVTGWGCRGLVHDRRRRLLGRP